MNQTIEIFMETCSKSDAIRHIKNGSLAIPIDEWKDFVNELDSELKNYTIDEIKQRKVEDVEFVEHNGKQYILVFVL